MYVHIYICMFFGCIFDSMCIMRFMVQKLCKSLKESDGIYVHSIYVKHYAFFVCLLRVLYRKYVRSAMLYGCWT